MKIKVLKRYRDKNTGVLHEIGETMVVTKERYQEINGTAHGTLVEEVKEKKKEK